MKSRKRPNSLYLVVILGALWAGQSFESMGSSRCNEGAMSSVVDSTRQPVFIDDISELPTANYTVPSEACISAADGLLFHLPLTYAKHILIGFSGDTGRELLGLPSGKLRSTLPLIREAGYCVLDNDCKGDEFWNVIDSASLELKHVKPRSTERRT